MLWVIEQPGKKQKIIFQGILVWRALQEQRIHHNNTLTKHVTFTREVTVSPLSVCPFFRRDSGGGSGNLFSFSGVRRVQGSYIYGCFKCGEAWVYLRGLLGSWRFTLILTIVTCLALTSIPYLKLTFKHVFTLTLNEWIYVIKTWLCKQISGLHNTSKTWNTHPHTDTQTHTRSLTVMHGDVERVVAVSPRSSPPAPSAPSADCPADLSGSAHSGQRPDGPALTHTHTHTHNQEHTKTHTPTQSQSNPWHLHHLTFCDEKFSAGIFAPRQNQISVLSVVHHSSLTVSLLLQLPVVSVYQGHLALVERRHLPPLLQPLGVTQMTSARLRAAFKNG